MKTRYSNDKGEAYYRELSAGAGGCCEIITDRNGHPVCTNGSGGNRPWHSGEWKAQVVK